MIAPLPPHEAERLEALQRYEILDTLPEQQFDDITLLASRICQTSIAMISLVDENRQWFKSRLGLTGSETPRDIAFCAHGILEPGVFVVNDAQADVRFATNPLVTGTPGIRFYAGAPLVTSDGHALGMLCVSDPTARELTTEQAEALRALGRQVVALLEARRTNADLQRAVVQLNEAGESLRESEERFAAAFEYAPIGVALSLPTGHILKANRVFCALLGYSEAELQTLTASSVTHPEDVELSEEMMRRALRGEARSFQIEKRYLHKLGHSIPTLLSFSLVRDSAGVLRYFVAQIQDMTDRIRSAEALQRSQKRLRDLIDGMGPTLFVWLLSPQGILLEVNLSPLAAVGLKAQDVLGRPFAETAWWSHSAVAQNQLRQAITRAAAGEVSRYDAEVWGTGDQVIDIDFSLQPLRDENGAVVFLIPSGSVITERKQMEGALRASEAEFRSLAEATPQMIWITRPDGACIYVSRQWTEYTGLTSEQSLGYGWIEPFHPDDQQRALSAWAQATAAAANYSIECRLRRVEGGYRWWLIRAVPQRDAAGNVGKWFGTCTDIQDLKMAELDISRANRELREAEAKYRSIFEHSNEGIFQCHPDGRFISANPRLARILGYDSPEQLIHARMDRGSSEAQRARRAEFLAELAARGFVHGYESEVWRQDGTRIWISENTRTVTDAAGHVAYHEGGVQDITQRKLAETALEKAHRELLAVSRQAGMAEVATGVLHNVGNVLNSVNVSATVVIDRVQHSKAGNVTKLAALLAEHKADLTQFLSTDSRGQMIPEYLAALAGHLADENEAIVTELGHLRKNIGHIKDIVAMQQSYARTSGIIETIPATEMIEDALQMNASSLARHGITIVRDYQARPLVTTDKHKVIQILLNLVRNAKHACDEVAQVEKRITLRLASEAGRVRITVSDNGVGIPAENLLRVFNHGFTTRAAGHGFGLHSGALAARELGGSLAVHSAGPGHGATFVLELPAEPVSRP